MLKNSKIVYRIIYILAIFMLLVFPLLSTALNSVATRRLGWTPFSDMQLAGVSTHIEKPVLSKRALWDGVFQRNFEEYYAQNLIWRQFLTRTLNQITYSAFGNTFAKSVYLGKDGYFFSPQYAIAYLAEMTEFNKEEIRSSLSDILELQALLAKRGVSLLLISSPSKAEYYSDKLPTAFNRYIDMKKSGEYSMNGYEMLKSEIKFFDIPFYDQSELFAEMVGNGELLFAKGGIHWTLHPMQEYINGLNEEIGRLLNKSLGKLEVVSEDNLFGTMGIHTDSDIFNIHTNALFAEPEYYSPNIVFSISEVSFAPDVLIVGSSFNWTILGTIYSVKNDGFLWGNTEFSFYNSYITSYPDNKRISEATDNYEEFLKKDIFIFEINEDMYLPTSAPMTFTQNMLNYLRQQEGIN